MAAYSQTPQPNLEEIIKQAVGQAANYSEVFKNLMAEEVKVFETFDKNGGKKVKRTVNSTFIVYGLQNSTAQIVEFRNVNKVDGKSVNDADKRAQSFFEKVSRADSSAKEREQLVDESLRYDPELKIDGLTLFQAVPLRDNLREVIEFTRLADDTINGRSVIVIAYNQTKLSPEIRVFGKNEKMSGVAALEFDLDLEIEPAGTERLKGTFWIDAKTFQIRREVRELTAKPENFPTSVVISKTDFNYSTSIIDAVTPSIIEYTDYRLDTKRRVSIPDMRVTFTYSKFSKADVEVKSAEIK